MLNSRKRRGPEFYKASGMDRLMCVAGVPERYWDITLETLPEPTDFWGISDEVIEVQGKKQNKRKRVSAKKQLAMLQTCLESMNKLRGKLIVVGSAPTDEWALSVGALFVKQALRRFPDVTMLDIANPVPDRIIETQIPPVAVLHNLTTDSTGHRMMACRDWLSLLEGSLIVVCYAGEDPRTFCENYLRKNADIELYAHRRFRKRRTISS